ncbi:MAG: GxxExxY protein [Planctomycetes bacterium]|nr:GxxExxY protein [Planctomycetota bacterium]
MDHRHDATTPRKDVNPVVDALASAVIDGAFAVHRELGPGLMESVYEACLCHELGKRGLAHRRQVVVPIRYDGIEVEAGLRLDLLVDERLIVELKAVDLLAPIHTAQALTYLKITGLQLALLINFNVPKLRDGIRRVVRTPQ